VLVVAKAKGEIDVKNSPSKVDSEDVNAIFLPGE
jgi:hypothetical protein